MANSLLISKFTATKHPATVESKIHRLPPHSFNLRFTPHVDLSRSSLKITAFKTPLQMKPPKSSSVDIQFQPMNHEADPSPIRVHKADCILKPLKKYAIQLVIVIMVVLLMSYPVSAWAKCSHIAWHHRPSTRRPPSDEKSDLVPVLVFIAMLISWLLPPTADDINVTRNLPPNNWRAGEDWAGTSVLKLQVGLLGKARSLQKDLELIAGIPCTSTHTVKSRVLTGTTRSLLCHPDYCVSAYSCVDIKRSVKGAEKMFEQLSIEEQAKFNGKTLVNVNNIQSNHPANLRARGHNNDYFVVTILVVVRGDLKIPTIKGTTDLENALQKLESIPPSKIRALKVLWTPQAEITTLSEKELLESYPLLKPL